MIRVTLTGAADFSDQAIGEQMKQEAPRALDTLLSGTGAGAEYTGWVRYPKQYDREELRRIRAAAEKIQGDSQVLLVLGIGGSYLGAKAALDLLRSPEYNLMPKKTPELFFVGNDASGAHIAQTIALIGEKTFSLCVVSKSGSTAETGAAFRVFQSLLEKRFGDGAKERIYAVTDREKGYLRATVREKGWESFVIPANIGGRYSVLTPVGLLPMAAAGIDIDRVLSGAAAEMDVLLSSRGGGAADYAAMRQTLYRGGKKIELLSCFEPAFRFVGEWWKQLFGESEGKNGKGIFPATAVLTSDLHSMGQMIQDGERTLFETIVSMPVANDVTIPDNGRYYDGLDFLGGERYTRFNETVAEATRSAHISGGVPVIDMEAGPAGEESFGALVYFFQLACGISGYLSGVNPFNQPGVEVYKKNMKALFQKGRPD